MNAPDGVGCPLTGHIALAGEEIVVKVLMHLMVLGAP